MSEHEAEAVPQAKPWSRRNLHRLIGRVCPKCGRALGSRDVVCLGRETFQLDGQELPIESWADLQEHTRRHGSQSLHVDVSSGKILYHTLAASPWRAKWGDGMCSGDIGHLGDEPPNRTLSLYKVRGFGPHSEEPSLPWSVEITTPTPEQREALNNDRDFLDRLKALLDEKLDPGRETDGQETAQTQSTEGG